MNETLELLQARRSVAPALLGDPGPSEAEIETLLRIASRVPDHGRLAPWRFIVLQGAARERIGEAIAAAYGADNPGCGPERIEVERKRLAHAPLVIAVVSRSGPHVKIPEWEQVLSAGAAAMTLVIAANAMGYATSWLTEWFGFDRRVLDALGLSPTERLAGFVHVGRAQQAPVERARPDLADIVTRL